MVAVALTGRFLADGEVSGAGLRLYTLYVTRRSRWWLKRGGGGGTGATLPAAMAARRGATTAARPIGGFSNDGDCTNLSSALRRTRLTN
jgi:hypothetical protein